MNPAAALALTILSPLLAAALAFTLPRAGRWIAAGAALAVTAGVTSLAREIRDRGAFRHTLSGWSAPLGIELRADGLAALMLLVTALIGIAIVLYSQRYFTSGHDSASSGAAHRSGYFWPLSLFLWAALNALFLSADIFNLYVALELLGFSAVMLVALAGGASALKASMRYLLVSLTGSLLYLLGVAIVYGAYATVDLSLLAKAVEAGPVSWIALALMTGGLLMKGAIFPMHFWLPPAHANAPAPVSALLSALVVKGSFYILLRLWFEAFAPLGSSIAAQFLGALGALAILWGSIQALLQARLKMLIAYSTVAQLGYLLLIFPLAWQQEFAATAWNGMIVFLVAHACAKTAMFLTAGNIMLAAGHDRIRDLDGITHVLPISIFSFALAGMSLVGLPPSSGFIGKWLMLNAALRQNQWFWVAVMIAGGLLAAAYVLRVLSHAFTRVPEVQMTNPIPLVMEWTAFALALLAVVLGFVANLPIAILRSGAAMPAAAVVGGLPL